MRRRSYSKTGILPPAGWPRFAPCRESRAQATMTKGGVLVVETRVGPYRLLRKIGRGGMGSVYEAVHETIERRVAIKVLDADSARQNDLSSRFLNEARAVNRVNDPGLVQMFDHGMLPDGAAYIVMEYLEGETLARRLRRLRRRMPVPELLRLLHQAAETLAATHRKGITHRDLKPDSVTIERKT